MAAGSYGYRPFYYCGTAEEVKGLRHNFTQATIGRKSKVYMYKGYILAKREEQLQKSMGEHGGSYKNNTRTSKFAVHAVNNKHSFN